MFCDMHNHTRSCPNLSFCIGVLLLYKYKYKLFIVNVKLVMD